MPEGEVTTGKPPAGSRALATWCEEVSRNGDLAAGIAATHYAVEGATGEWLQRIHESAAYAASLPVEGRGRSLRWLQLHAAYDDTHPWEALEILCTLVGATPGADQVQHWGEGVRRSYTSMRITLDHCIDRQGQSGRRVEAAA